jgi:hypothetical protein
MSTTAMKPNAIPMTSLAPGVDLQVPPKSTASLTPAVLELNEGISLPWGSIRGTPQSPCKPPATTTAKAPKLTKWNVHRPTWSPINKCIAASGLVIAILAIIATLYFGIMSGPGSPADRRAIWSSHNDFRSTCLSELDSGLPRSPSCDKILAQPAEPPPDLEKRDGIFTSSSYFVLGIVLAFVATAVIPSALLYMATRFFGSLHLTTVTWQAFDVNEKHEFSGIARTFARPKTPPLRSSNAITRFRQKIPSPHRSHEYGLLSAQVLMADLSNDWTGIATAHIVKWKELCHQSATRRLHTIKVPLLPHDDKIGHLLLNSVPSLQQSQKQEQDPEPDPILHPKSRISLPSTWEAEEAGSDRSAVSREHLYVLLDTAMLGRRRPTMYDLNRLSEPALEFDFGQFYEPPVPEFDFSHFYEPPLLSDPPIPGPTPPIRYPNLSPSGHAGSSSHSHGYEEKRVVRGRKPYKNREMFDDEVEGTDVFGGFVGAR